MIEVPVISIPKQDTVIVKVDEGKVECDVKLIDPLDDDFRRSTLGLTEARATYRALGHAIHIMEEHAEQRGEWT